MGAGPVKSVDFLGFKALNEVLNSLQRKRVFATNSDGIITISLEPDDISNLDSEFIV